MKITDPTVVSVFTVWLSHRWICGFQSGLINSKKNPKNVKFGLQVHFNIEITSNGLDRPLDFENQKKTWLHESSGTIDCILANLSYREWLSSNRLFLGSGKKTRFSNF